jgi:hypothetical protein
MLVKQMVDDLPGFEAAIDIIAQIEKHLAFLGPRGGVGADLADKPIEQVHPAVHIAHGIHHDVIAHPGRIDWGRGFGTRLEETTQHGERNKPNR